jgi:malate dehydrogenase (oxaloacetate-decarboxylating)(NADP+)
MPVCCRVARAVALAAVASGVARIALPADYMLG